MNVADLPGKGTAEFLRPQPDRLMRDNNPSAREHVLDHPQAQWKAELEPHGVGEDFGGKAVAAI
jgi:hypothetical protein